MSMILARNFLAATLGELLSAAAHPAAGQPAPRLLFDPSPGAGATRPLSKASTPEAASGSGWSGSFATPAGELWFVSSVTVEVPSEPLAIPPSPIDLTFAFDDAGRPGAAVCERAGIVPTVASGGPDSPRLTLDLPTACQLCAGTR